MDGGSWDAPWITYVDFHFEDKYVEVGMGLITSLTRPLLSMLMLLGRCMRGTGEGGRSCSSLFIVLTIFAFQTTPSYNWS